MAKIEQYKDQRLISVQTRLEPKLYEEAQAYKKIVGVEYFSEFSRMAIRFFIDHLKKKRK